MSQLRNLVSKILRGGLWHTTPLDHFNGIISTGAILPDPPNVSEFRYNVGKDSTKHSYVHNLDGVSLFDFEKVDPMIFCSEHPTISLATFVPIHSGWRSAVWIEINRQSIASQLISALNLLVRWKTDESRKRIMAHVEAAHIGPLPVTAFKRIFMVHDGDVNIYPIPLIIE